VNKSEVFKVCKIDMPIYQKRNMMNAFSNFNIIYSILDSIKNKRQNKIHSPIANGEIGGYPVILDGRGYALKAHFDVSFFRWKK
jgi:hypothetical protein